MFKFRNGRESDLLRLREIWGLCFDDRKEYVDFFFDRRFKVEQCFVLTDLNDIVVSMLFALPFSLKVQNSFYSAVYLYAVATHPDFQNQGLSSQLLENTQKALTVQGVKVMALVPETDEVFSFYSKRGFKNSFAFDVFEFEFEFNSFEDTSGKVSEITAKKYYEIRNKTFANLPVYGVWDETAIDYHGEFSKLDDGGLFLVEIGKDKAVALLEIYDGVMFVRELVVEERLVRQAIISLCVKMGTKKCVVRLPVGFYDCPLTLPFPARGKATKTSGIRKDFGMCKWLGEEVDFNNGYLSFTLD